MAYDLVIRGGTLVDGSGAPRFTADVGIKDGMIAEIGRITSAASHTIEADGLIVSPGFIDGHTHMDAQVAWDPLGSCSCWHGVTSVVMSNCGFALAPCRPEDRDLYARCLSAVEDIPTEAMAAGIDWTWETFPEYLETVERLPKAINYGMYIGHSALRMYAMGKRAFTEKATEDEMVRMADLVKQALRAGAMGFSSSRASTHVTPDNTPVASRIAEWEEIDRIVAAMAELDAGIFQVGPDIASGPAHRAFLARLREVALTYKRPVMFGVLATKQGDDPTGWAYQTRYIDETVAAGGRMYGQGTTRSINAIFSLKSYLPFDVLPAWRKVRELPLHEQKRRLADPEVRRELVAAEERMKPRDNVFQGGGAATTDPRKPDYSNLYALNGVDWDDPTVEQLARARGQHPVEVLKGPDGCVSGLACRYLDYRMDTKGRMVLVEDETAGFSLEADTIVTAAGWEANTLFLRDIPGLEFNADGSLRTKPEHAETGVRGVFAAGGVVEPEMSLTDAMLSGTRAAQEIEKYLNV